MKYDTIVIGAGSAGAILATRLSEDPQRAVLLLEAGPDYPEFERIPDELKFGYGMDRNIWAKTFSMWDRVTISSCNLHITESKSGSCHIKNYWIFSWPRPSE